MPSRVNHVNKTTGVTYVYESISYWDKEKKQSRNKQVCVGKLDPLNGEFIPSKRLAPTQAIVKDLEVITASAEIVGPSIVLDAITEQLGLGKLLKSCFPKEHSQIQAMAYYLASRGGPLSYCGTWCKSHAHSVECLTSQRISEILESISTDKKQTFFTKWMDKVLEDDDLCYDIIISSYSEVAEYINHDLEKHPQL